VYAPSFGNARSPVTDIRATASPVPYVEAVRKIYTERGWRKQA